MKGQTCSLNRGDKKYVHDFVEMPIGKDRRWKDDISMDIKEIGSKKRWEVDGAGLGSCRR
jgi:hypothetical protein